MSRLIPFTGTPDLEISRSEGCYHFDKNDNAYLDMESGVWCANLGFNNQRINKAITRQLAKTAHLGYHVCSAESEELASVLGSKLRLPGSKSVFLSSGSEAVDLSISIAQAVTGRNSICKIEGSYLSAFGQAKSSNPSRLVSSINNNDFEKISSTDFSRISAFVFEPGTSWGKIQFPTKEFISTLVKKARDSGCLIISDEVTTGMGRTGRWFGFEHYRISPDIVVTGKALGNGYPVSGVTISGNLSAGLESNLFRYAQSHQNDPMGCAIALSVIKEIDRSDLVHKSEENGILFKSLLKTICLKYDDIKEIRGRGLMLAMEFADPDFTERTHHYLMEKRIICGMKENVIRFMPPLIISHKLIHETSEIIESGINKLKS